jgi:hypothetical protein
MQDPPEASMGEKAVSEPTLETVLQRLTRLEQQVRHWRALGLVALALLGLIVLVGATKGQNARVAEEIGLKQSILTDNFIAELKCVDLIVHYSADSQPMTEQQLRDILLMAVKTKLPRLSVQPCYSSRLILDVTFLKITQGAGEVLIGLCRGVSLTVQRNAVILDTRLL